MSSQSAVSAPTLASPLPAPKAPKREESLQWISLGKHSLCSYRTCRNANTLALLQLPLHTPQPAKGQPDPGLRGGLHAYHPRPITIGYGIVPATCHVSDAGKAFELQVPARLSDHLLSSDLRHLYTPISGTPRHTSHLPGAIWDGWV